MLLMASMNPPRPWSVPMAPFSWTVRPNSVMTSTSVLSMRVAEVLVEGDEAVGEVLEHLAVAAVDVALAAVVVPAAVVGLGDFEADVGLDDLGDRAELVAEAAAGVVAARSGRPRGLEGLDAGDGVGAGLVMMSRVLSAGELLGLARRPQCSAVQA